MNELMGKTVRKIITAGAITAKPEDYTGKDGLIYCGKCHTARQFRYAGIDGAAQVLPILCDCRASQEAINKAARKKAAKDMRIDQLLSDGLCIKRQSLHSFDEDDQPDTKPSKTCRRYVEKWPDIKRENIGLIFSGTVGTGKSFYAQCIARALLDKSERAGVTSLPQILNALQSVQGRQDLIEKLNRFTLLVLDDVGTERSSDYALEQIFNIVDARQRAGLPLIITTNKAPGELRNVEDLKAKRIYDRIFEMCPVSIVLNGESRREDKANAKRRKAAELLR